MPGGYWQVSTSASIQDRPALRPCAACAPLLREPITRLQACARMLKALADPTRLAASP